MDKYCPSCRMRKSLDQFSEKVTVPGQLYRDCDYCRKNNLVRKPKQSYKREVEIMRAKAFDMRKFDPVQDLALLTEHKAGKTYRELAAVHSVHKDTVRKAVKRAQAALDKQ